LIRWRFIKINFNCWQKQLKATKRRKLLKLNIKKKQEEY